MRIGIITFHHSKSFGAVLQAYGLCRYLESKGHRAEIVDYRPWRVIRRKFGFTRSSLRKPLAFLEHNLILRSRFRRFIKRNVPRSASVYWRVRGLRYCLKSYDLFIVGSDQVWNTQIFHYFDSSYYLDFVPAGEGRIYSYAASFGEDQPRELYPRIEQLLRRFDQISVRETQGAELVEKLVGVTPPVVLDPTLLITNYEPVLENPPTGEKYIAVYCLEVSSGFIKLVKEVKQLTGLPVVCLGSESVGFGSIRRNIDPGQWLGYLKNAEYICTNSFHGVVFSIILRKRFLVFPISHRFVRIKHFLEVLGLSSRIVNQPDDGVVRDRIAEEIDYDSAQLILDKLRDASEQYLNGVVDFGVNLENAKVH